MAFEYLHVLFISLKSRNNAQSINTICNLWDKGIVTRKTFIRKKTYNDLNSSTSRAGEFNIKLVQSVEETVFLPVKKQKITWRTIKHIIRHVCTKLLHNVKVYNVNYLSLVCTKQNITCVGFTCPDIDESPSKYTYNLITSKTTPRFVKTISKLSG